MQGPILIIGGGHMGGALARGFVASSLVPASAITLVEPAEEKRAGFAAEGFVVSESLVALPASYAPAATVLAIKPQGFAALAPSLASFYQARPASLILSILAGTTLAQLRAVFGAAAPLVRAMPNTPALIGEGVSACVGTGLSDENKHVAMQLLSSVGQVVWLENESLIDVVTAVSGSGPAYMFHMLECLVESGVKNGLSEAEARQLATATMRGAAGLATHAAHTALAELRRNVTSPGGTTEAALAQLMPALPSLIDQTVSAAIARAKALAEPNS